MSGTYLSDGARLSYVDAGAGLPVVFLHPTPLDHDYWRPLVAELAQVRAIVPDLRGHGASELGGSLPVGGFAMVADAPVLHMSQLAADVRVLLDQLSVREAIFIGCSIGGYVLLELWRQVPGCMRGLAFVCSKPQEDTQSAREKRASNIAQARTTGVDRIFDGMAQSLIGATARREAPGMVPELRSHMRLSTDAFVAVQAGLGARPDSMATVATIKAPVLAVAGGEDTGIAPGDMEAFRAAPGGCEFHLLPEAGHFAAFEYPVKVGAILGTWLRRLTP